MDRYMAGLSQQLLSRAFSLFKVLSHILPLG